MKLIATVETRLDSCVGKKKEDPKEPRAGGSEDVVGLILDPAQYDGPRFVGKGNPKPLVNSMLPILRTIHYCGKHAPSRSTFDPRSGWGLSWFTRCLAKLVKERDEGAICLVALVGSLSYAPVLVRTGTGPRSIREKKEFLQAKDNHFCF